MLTTRKKIRTHYQKIAKRLYPKAVWISGDGRYALVAHCRALTITLHNSIDNAKDDKHYIDEMGCGGCCVGFHRIRDLAKVGVRQ